MEKLMKNKNKGYLPRF